MAKQASVSRAGGTATRSYVRRLESLIDASDKLNSALDLNQLLRIILELATRNLNADRGTIYLIDQEKKELWSKVLKGRELVEIRLPVGTGIAGTVAKTGKTINLKDAWKDRRFFSGFDLRTGFQTKTMLCMPMRNRKGKIIGVFQIINKKRGTFDREDEQFLDAFSDHAALAIETAYLHQAIVEKERVEREIQIAAEIQQRLLPKTLPSIPGYELDGIAIPCKTIGGDYYDLIPLPDGRQVITVADVSGKGIPASLLVSTLHASLHAYLEANLQPLELVRRLNAVVYDNTPPERFITFFFAILDPAANTFTYINAGHNFPYLLSEHEREVRTLPVGGLPLGMFEFAEYATASVPLGAADNVVLYTDGVTEAMNPALEEYGEDRFQNCLRANLGQPLGVLRELLVQDIHSFTGLEPQSDDITLFLLRRTP